MTYLDHLTPPPDASTGLPRDAWRTNPEPRTLVVCSARIPSCSVSNFSKFQAYIDTDAEDGNEADGHDEDDDEDEANYAQDDDEDDVENDVCDEGESEKDDADDVEGDDEDDDDDGED